MSLINVIGLVLAILIACWAAKTLARQYIKNKVQKNRICITCLSKPKPEIIVNAEWDLNDVNSNKKEEAIAVCDKCIKILFPNELASIAEREGFIEKKIKNRNA